MSPVLRLWFRRLWVASWVLAVIAVLSEGMARVVYEPPPIRRVFDPFAYRIPQPGLLEDFTGLEGMAVEIRLNELGMRGPSISEHFSASTLTVVFLGGSTTENYALPTEHTFPELAGRLVAERLGRPVRVLNAGMSSATTSVSLGRLQHQVIDLRPDLVVVMHGINDLLWGFHPDFRLDGRHLERPALAGQRPRSFLLDALRRLDRRRRRQSAPDYQPNLERRSFDDFAARRVFERNLRSMSAIAAAHDFPLLLLTQPTMYGFGQPSDYALMHSLAGLPQRPDEQSLALGMRAMNETALALGHEERPGPRAQVLDLAAAVPRRQELIYDDCHLTALGNVRVAEAISPTLIEVLSP